MSSVWSIVLIVIGVLCALAGTVFLYIFVLPEGKREKLPKVLKILHDIFNFKSLLLEKVLKALYTLSTLICVFVGFFMLFSFRTSYSYFGGSSLQWDGGYGILLMIAGPIVLRLAYEGIMMFILLVKNTIQINNKLTNQNSDAPANDIFDAKIIEQAPPVPADIEAPVEYTVPVDYTNQ